MKMSVSNIDRWL